MTERREDEVKDGEIERRDIPLSAVWDQVTSELGGFFTPDTTGSLSFLDVSTAAQATPTRAVSPSGEMTTTNVAIPVSTVTVAETSFRTTYVTVQLTTDIPATYAPASTTVRETTSSTSSSSSKLSSSRSSDSSTHTNAIPLPTFITSSQPSATVSGAPAAETHDGTSAPPATADQAVNDSSRKHAIVGGLSGSIVGLVLIGLIACLCWRRRKPRFDDDDADSMSEKGLRPMFTRKWSDLKSRSQAPKPPPAVVTRGSTPDPEPDGQILRVSLDNWARPYAHDQGFRESVGPTTLRVMNPDLSRPTTPLRPSIETAGSFLKRQRFALAAALYGRPSSRAESPQRIFHVPASNVDPALSTEFLAPKAIAPSIRSTSTNNSVPVIIQHPPEDPFLTPPDETEERTEYTTKPVPAARPGIAPLQGAAGGLSRTLSQFGNTLNPFRTRSNASASSRSVSRHSTSTFSSAGDPFMLDRRSLRSNVGRPARREAETERGRSGNVMMYEGT